MKLYLDMTPTKVHFAPPEKPYADQLFGGGEFPYYIGARHFNPSLKKNMYSICGPECVYCAYTDPQRFGLDIAPNPDLAKIRREHFYGVSGWVEEQYHKVTMSRDDGSGTFTVRKRCTGKECEHCLAKAPRVFGNKFFYQFSSSAWRSTVFEALQYTETHCRCGGAIYIPAYLCPECQEVMIDTCMHCNCGADANDIAINTETLVAACQKCQLEWNFSSLNNPDILEQMMTETACQKCGNKVSPTPWFVCSTEGCAADPCTVYDAQLILHKESTDQKAKVVLKDYPKIQEPDPRLFDPKYQGLGAGNDKAAEDAEWMRLPLNLTEIFTPDDPATLAAILGVPNPFAKTGLPATQGPAFRPYNKK